MLNNKKLLKPKPKIVKTKRNWDPCSDDFSGPWVTKLEREDETALTEISE